MDIAFKIANSVIAKSLQHHLFRQEFKGQELLLHTDIRWLSNGKFLQKFQDLLQEIKVFLQNKCDNYAKLNNLVWKSDLAFLADFTGRLSAYLQLQAKSKPVIELISAIGASPILKKNGLSFSQTSKTVCKIIQIVFGTPINMLLK